MRKQVTQKTNYSPSQVTTWLTQNYEPAKIGICRDV